ncbi:MAG: hypothetical protein A3F67_05300 [Verrucomicrobia bacterium RIFCSPHIGHO2_12_FULL_41_10]|nr:MAG: hypothetical protein A3F67_05300 [Verrucomicrobia bacterium RIFCSPHIGHO2_12_FULL_41_10]HLB34456.1 type III secretion system chaperone [Chthoniobacterales bacterium]
MPLSQFTLLLKECGDAVGIHDLAPDDHGFASLLIDDALTIDLEYNEEDDLMVLSSVLGTIPIDQIVTLYPEFLEANLFWNGTGGGTLGVDPTTHTLFLCYRENLGMMDLQRFQQLLQGFGDASLYWSRRITSNVTEAERN